MKKAIIISTICALCQPSAFAQILHPVKWSYGTKRLNSKQAVIFLKATIEDGWHIYSVNQKDGGQVKTSFSFFVSPSYLLLGTISEPTPITKREEAFNMDVSYFEHDVICKRKIRATNPAAINGSVNFMVCNNQKCLPPETIEFTILIN
jgi:DsbC/DsbD-like thiol-disulfide interchange protein